MTNEELMVYNKAKEFRESHDKLYVIMEELEDLIKMGYNGTFNGSETEGLIRAFAEYKKWQNKNLD